MRALRKMLYPFSSKKALFEDGYCTSRKSTDKSGSISIIIPAFNEAGYIGKTLESVFRASAEYSGKVEVIVVDNNSTDATGEIARLCGATVVFEPKNQIARARNAGANAASGDYLIFLDADTTIHGNILDKVNDHLSSGLVIGGGTWVDPDSGWLARLMFRVMVNDVLALKNVTIGPFIYCERAAFEQVEGFDEEFFAAEEFSFAKRLKRAGRKSNKKWKIIGYDRDHRVITSNRKFQKFGGLEMVHQNAHLIWKPHHKVKDKDYCQFWYQARK